MVKCNKCGWTFSVCESGIFSQCEDEIIYECWQCFAIEKKIKTDYYVTKFQVMREALEIATRKND